jgi:Sulfotransferase family
LEPPVAAYASSWTSIAHNYAQYRRYMSAAESAFTGDVFELDYEKFVQNPEHVLRDLLHFLGLAWDERCLRFHSQTNAVKTASLWQIRQPIHVGSQGRWRAYREQLQPLIAALLSNGVPLPSLE